jgi:hypothetical protein
MSRHSTPATRAYARDKAEIIGQAERVIYGELQDLACRVAYHWATPTVAVVAFVAYIFFAHVLVGMLP